MTVNNETIISVCRAFGIEGDFIESKIFTDGHINSTYLAVFRDGEETKKYLVQNINTVVFKDQQALMDNIINVTSFLRKKIEENGGDPTRETLHFLKSKDGKYYYQDDKNCWRIYDFIDNSFTYNMIDSREVFEDTGRSFGRFQCLLSEYPIDNLFETIPDFHNTPKRLQNLISSVEKDVVGRAAEVKKEIDFALNRKEDTERALALVEKGEIPLRVTHNDTKLNNILFDSETNKGICVIDLDTIMPGLSLYDFGDAIRFGAKTAAEDEADLSKVSVSLDLYESYVKGYLESCAEALTKAEVENLAFSAKLMTFECGMRFLTDYLDGDVYFKTEYPEHNLVRARNQFKMVEEIEKVLPEMEKITVDTYRLVTGKSL